MTGECSIPGCGWSPAAGEWLRRGMCRRHYGQSVRGTLNLNDPDPLIESDQVRSPADLPVPFKAVTHRADGTWAVMLPYPSFDGTQPCTENPAMWDEDDDSPNSRGLRLAACKRCPFRISCFEWGMAHEEYGYFGGAPGSTRDRLRRARGQRLVTPQVGGDSFPDRRWDEVLFPAAWQESDELEEEWSAA